MTLLFSSAQENMFGNVYQLSACFGVEFLERSACSQFSVMDVINATFAKHLESNTCSDQETCCPDHIDETCITSDVREQDPIYWRSILDACNGKWACDGLISHDVELPCSQFWSRKYNDLTLIYYRCIPRTKITRCVGAVFDEQLCPVNTSINITSAQISIPENHNNCSNDSQICCPVNTDLLKDVETTDDVYMEEIRTKCNGFRKCQGLLSKEICLAGNCSQYTLINYMCLESHFDMSMEIHTAYPVLTVIPRRLEVEDLVITANASHTERLYVICRTALILSLAISSIIILSLGFKVHYQRQKIKQLSKTNITHDIEMAEMLK